MPEDIVYECPECGESITEGMKFCPGCQLELEWEEGPEETVDALLDDIERSEEPAATIEEAPGEPEEAPYEEPAPEYEPAPEPEPEPAYEPEPEPEPEPVAAAPAAKGGPMSKLGIAFVVLTIVALVATLLAARYDTWVQGASEESVGDRQQLFIYLGVVGIIVCAVIAVFDMMRNRKKVTA